MIICSRHWKFYLWWTSFTTKHVFDLITCNIPKLDKHSYWLNHSGMDQSHNVFYFELFWQVTRKSTTKVYHVQDLKIGRSVLIGKNISRMSQWWGLSCQSLPHDTASMRADDVHNVTKRSSDHIGWDTNNLSKCIQKNVPLLDTVINLLKSDKIWWSLPL